MISYLPLPPNPWPTTITSMLTMCSMIFCTAWEGSQTMNGHRFCKKISFCGLDGETSVPVILVQCGVHVTRLKLKLINKALINWQTTTQKKIRGQYAIQLVPAGVMNDDATSDDLSGSKGWYISKMAPGQLRLYCKTISYNKRVPDPKINQVQYFYPNNPLGRNTIRSMFKEGTRILGLPNWENLLLIVYVLCLLPRWRMEIGVSDKELMGSTHHNSLSASANYQERDSKSETNKFEALGIKQKR